MIPFSVSGVSDSEDMETSRGDFGLPSDKDMVLNDRGLSAANDDRGMRARSPSSDRRSSDRYTLHDFNFIKVLGKGSFGKVS